MRKLRDSSSKSCPDCTKKVGAALKICKCGFNFTKTSPKAGRPSSSSSSTTTTTARGRVTATAASRRTRAAKKPNFYDSQEFDKKKKGKKTTPTRAAAKATILNKQQIEKEQSRDLREARAKQRRMKKEEIEDVDLAGGLSSEKQELAKVILAEINRKLGSVVWQPSF